MAKNKKLGFSYTLGSDPELMLYSMAEKRIVSSIPVLKRDKHNPIILDEANGIKAYADNVLLETAFNPCKSKDEMLERFRVVFQNIQNHLGDKYKLVPKAAHEFPMEDLKEAYGINPMQIGCDPSYNAWLKQINNPGEFQSGLRTGSCHFHIGNDKLTDFNTRLDAIKVLDIYLGCSFVIVDKDPTSRDRRTYYGQSSEHRPCDYGLEYRVLSPYVLKSPKLLGLALDIIDFSMQHIKNDTAKQIIESVDSDMVINAINKCDLSLAKSVLTKAELPLSLMKRIEDNYGELDLYKEWSIK